MHFQTPSWHEFMNRNDFDQTCCSLCLWLFVEQWNIYLIIRLICILLGKGEIILTFILDSCKKLKKIQS
jgi:hypothetical protein